MTRQSDDDTFNARLSRCGYRATMLTLGTGLGALLALPFAALALDGGPAAIASGLSSPSAWPALRLTLLTTVAATAIVVIGGTPVAWWLAATRWRPARWVETLLQLPVVIPPAVGGLALLLAFGRHGLVGRWLDRLGCAPAFTVAAVVIAQVFVSAPFYLHTATLAFAGMDRMTVVAARSTGASPPTMFFRVALPLTSPALLSGAAMSWARALGEFGATLMFAGNYSGRTQTLPLAIYAAVESDLRTAQALSLVLVTLAFAVLLASRRLGPEPAPAAPRRGSAR